MSNRPLKTEEELESILEEAQRQVPKGLYRHSGNGKEYLVTGYAISRYSGEPCVIYEAQYGAHLPFIRTLPEWFLPEVKDGKEVLRFQKI